MAYRIAVRVDPDHSVDPSYIVHYRVTDDGRMVGDGIVQYHRLAGYNDIPVNENIPPEAREQVKRHIINSVTDYINYKRG
ncbi:hypothetical protein IT084_04275 [Desulfallas sp. Bu1-1]|uniref:hypothetical protein n=1 Tax=Desulfallas sp. Bu1-1 TaxID=2787620 RepID=UPI00189F875E|nr:hypothetical protein [Desulfallas sp. Bu1-1]MBF7082191.1 hypothetical protein [Desulfallas sp. Bu1-1]